MARLNEGNGDMRKRRHKEPGISAANQAMIELVVDLLFQTQGLVEQLADAQDDSYIELLNAIHRRIPEPWQLQQVLSDSDDSEMRCPK